MLLGEGWNGRREIGKAGGAMVLALVVVFKLRIRKLFRFSFCLN